MEIATPPTGHEPHVDMTTACVDSHCPVRSSATQTVAVPLSATECRATMPRRTSDRDPLRERLLEMILQNETFRKTARRFFFCITT